MLIGSVPKNASKTHKKLFSLIERVKPNHKVFCEYSAKKLLLEYWEKHGIHYWDRDSVLLVRSRSLHFDFYDETFGIVFEVQGEQHYKVNNFFHKNEGDLDQQKMNDSCKRTVCKTANIKLVEIASDIELTEKFIMNLYKGGRLN